MASEYISDLVAYAAMRRAADAGADFPTGKSNWPQLIASSVRVNPDKEKRV